MRKFFRVLRRIAFVLVLLSILLHVNRVFERKTLNDAWNYTLKVGGFANEPLESFQVIGFGSSHMYCTLNPVYLYEQTGVRSYVLATQYQPIEATYYYIKEALETQTPDVVILEGYKYLLDAEAATEGVAHDAVDPFPDGKNKLDMISALDTVDGKENYYFNFLKYHTRWKTLSKTDFDFSYTEETDPMHGYVFLTGIAPNENAQPDYSEVSEVALDALSIEYLDKTIELIESKGCKVLLLLSPFQMSDECGRAKALHRYAEEAGVPILDMNLCYDEIGIDSATDFYDLNHLNVFGSEKASIYLYEYLCANFAISDRSVDDDALWQEDISEYYHQRNGT